MNFSIENKLDTIEIRIPMGFNKGGSSDTSLWFASIHSIPHQFGFHQECPDVFSEIDCEPFSKIYPALRSLLFPAVSDRWEIYGRSPLHPDWEGPRGWRTPRNFPRPALPPSLFFSAVTLERHVSKSETMIFFFQEYILSGRDGIWKTCGGTIWISYRPRPLLFPLTEGLGALRRPPQTNQTSACTMGASFEFPSKLVSVLPRPIWFEYLILFLRHTVSADKLLP